MAQRQNSPVLRYFHKLFEREELASLSTGNAASLRAALRAALLHWCAGTALWFLSLRRVLKDPADERTQSGDLPGAARGRAVFGWHDSIGTGSMASPCSSEQNESAATTL